MSIAKPQRRKILVAVDFGTTYSAISWGDTRLEETITNWPGGRPYEVKVPTTLQYDWKGDLTGWGWEVDRGSQNVIREMFKLGLDPGKQRQTRLASLHPDVVQEPSGIDYAHLTETYLNELRSSFEEHLTLQPDHLGLKSSERQYIITVPAVWSDQAKRLTRHCARNAGMGNSTEDIIIESEPEAAAIRVLGDMKEQNVYYGLEEGDSFVVCDAGGGTVDLISYVITKVRGSGRTKVPEVMEAMQGEGHVCGGLFINRLFAEHLKTTYPAITEQNIRGADRIFEDYIKKPFTGSMTTTRMVDVPDQGKLALRGSVIKGFFDPVVSEIIDLVQNQIDGVRRLGKKVSYLILVGGFGSNKYLKSELEKNIGRDIKVYWPRDNGCLTAVVEGALMKHLANPPMVKARVARRNYGTSCRTAYDENKHAGLQQSRSVSTGQPEVWALRWLVKKGQRMSLSGSLGLSWERSTSQPMLESIDMDIFSHDAEQEGSLPIDPQADDVTKIGTLRVRAQDLPDPVKKTERQTGREWFEWDFDIRMSLESAHLTFSIWVDEKQRNELPIMDCF